MKRMLAAVVITATGLHASACGPYFDYTYIVAASPGRAFKLPELSMAHELGKIPLDTDAPRVRSVLPEDVTLRSLCNIGPLPKQLAEWYDDLVDEAATADLTDLFVTLTDAGVDRETTTQICRNYFSIRAGFDENLSTWALAPVHIGLFEALGTLAQLPREFYLYLDGARAFHQKKYGEAVAAFDAILALPPEQRHYRTTWAFYMLGRMAAMAQRDPDLGPAHPEIVTDPLPLFELARQSAVEGFADTHDLTAGSHYQEVLLAVDLCDPVRELHALAHYNLPGNQNTTWMLTRATKKIAEMDTIPSEVLADRLSRSMLVAFAASHVDARPKQAEHILKALKTSGLELTPYESGRLAWTAYTVGQFDEAKSLVGLAPEDPYALWTKSRLQLRRGDLKGALAFLQKTLPLFDPTANWDRFDEPDYGERYKPFDALHSEQAILQLARNHYVEALDLFLTGESWLDAAYVAEHVLTLDELLVYYRKCDKEKRYTEPVVEYKAYSLYIRPPLWKGMHDSDSSALPRDSQLDRLRVLVGRRMLRENRYSGAAELFPECWRPLAVAYVHHRQVASTAPDNKSRAFHQIQSAHLLRHWGMELIGYEADPDFSYVGGDFYYQETSAIRADSETWRRFAASAMARSDYICSQGNEWENEFDENWMKTIPDYIPFVKPTNEERRRLQLNGPKLYRRWHYRFVAADLFKQAAALLPDQTEEKAQALFYGGEVLKRVDRYKDAVTRMGSFHRALVRHCGTLEIAQAAKEKKWFPDEPQAWEQTFGPSAINAAALAIANKKVASTQ